MALNSKVPPGARFTVERLEVFEVALELVALFDTLGSRLWTKNSSLWRQLQRALASVVANIGEAAGCRSRAEQCRYFEYAYRSSSECAALLIAFVRIDALKPDEAESARQLLHSVQMMLARLIGKNREARSEKR